MAYREYKVRPGDCISSIACRFGFLPDAIWHDPKNGDLRAERKDPNVLMPGDVVYIRDLEEKEETCSSEKKHRFQRKGVPEKLVLRFEIENGPRADEAYVIEIDGSLSDGRTDADGLVEITIPPDAKNGKITFVETQEVWKLALGRLDPITELSGVRARLANLGFYAGQLDGEPCDELAEAIAAFQAENDLDPTGELDAATRSKIEDRFGG